MPQPYDYRLNIPSPSDQVLGALSITEKMQQIKNGRAAETSQAQLQQDLGLLYDNPNPANVAKMMAKYPQLSEQLKRTHDVLDVEQQKTRLNQATGVYAALEAGEEEVAKELLAEQAAAYRNSGMEKEAKTLDDLAKLIELDPSTARTSTGLFLASTMGPDKFTETFTKLEADRRLRASEKATLTEAQAKAKKAAVEADFAESNAVLDLQKKGWDITKLQEDVKISKENARIAAMNAQLKKEGNELKKDELRLKIEEAKRKRDEELKERTAEFESTSLGIDNSLNTIDRLLKNPELDNVIGALEGSKFYPSTLFAIMNPLADADVRADATADIETAQSQQFLDNLMAAKQRGATFGSLTEREGAKLEGYIRSLKTKQSEKQFRANLREIQRLLLKSRSSLVDKYGIPESIPDTPEVEVGPADIEALLQKYRGGQATWQL